MAIVFQCPDCCRIKKYGDWVYLHAAHQLNLEDLIRCGQVTIQDKQCSSCASDTGRIRSRNTY